MDGEGLTRPEPGIRHQDDVFEHAMRQVPPPVVARAGCKLTATRAQVYRAAAPEMVSGFREKMDFIKVRYKHNEKTVESCLNGLGDAPTLLQLLTAAFVVNGGVLFKHGPNLEEQEAEQEELSKLIQEFDQLRQDDLSSE
jgi:hypothetical protein